jgi:cation transporter-like permease
MLKYRLYEIDRIISRTLAYAIVTGLLVGVYAGLVLLATRVLPASHPVAVAGSTLVAAALFSPLRSRVQRAVDRRFNRARYDADQMVTAFAARLKDAVNRCGRRGPDRRGVPCPGTRPHIGMGQPARLRPLPPPA